MNKAALKQLRSRRDIVTQQIKKLKMIVVGLDDAIKMLEDEDAGGRSIAGNDMPTRKSTQNYSANLNKHVEVNGVLISLSPLELKIFNRLKELPDGERITVESLTEVMGSERRALNSANRLRKKLELANCGLSRVMGRGYRLESLS